MKPLQSDFDCITLSQSVFGPFQGATVPIVPRILQLLGNEEVP